MRIGIDFDNTIVCYDAIFEQLAIEYRVSLSTNSSPKQAVQNHLKSKENGEWLWAKIQGEVYGPRILEAQAYPQLIKTLGKLKKDGHHLAIISHKTKYPNVGDPHPLQGWAREWIRQNLGDLVEADSIFFNESKAQKLNCITRLECDCFVDDLESILCDPRFPLATQRILFSPNTGSSFPNVAAVNSWLELPALLETHKPQPKPQTIASVANVSPIGMNDPNRLSRLNGGRNNEVYKFAQEDGANCVLKVYSNSPNDLRKRFESETSFLRYAQSSGILNVPNLLETNAASRTAVLEFISGPLATTSPQKEDWEQCLQFVCDLQTSKNSDEAEKLPQAAEFSESYQEHLDWISPRRNLWLESALEISHNTEFKEWILKDLEETFQRLGKVLISSRDFRSKLDQEELILSPSDFGLHNAIRKPDSSLVFIDFEYAGWDDPAKLLADFFLQPRSRPPQELYPLWRTAIERLIPETSRTKFGQRLPYIEAICSMKWVYIILKNRLDPKTLLPKSEDEETQSVLDSLHGRLNDLNHSLAKLMTQL